MLEDGHQKKLVQKTPHVVVLDKGYYNQVGGCCPAFLPTPHTWLLLNQGIRPSCHPSC